MTGKKGKKVLKKTLSVLLASVMAGSAAVTSVSAAPSSGTAQSFSLGDRVSTIVSDITDLLSGKKKNQKDTHKTADSFASKRVLVRADKLKGTDRKKVIGSYDGYYLLKYGSASEARKACSSYMRKSDGTTSASADVPVHAASGTANNGGLAGLTKSENPLSEARDSASDLTKSEVRANRKENVIALLDTGSGSSDNVIDAVSMIGDSAEDDNGHGTAMIKAIAKQNRKAKIISVKVLDSRGEGSASSLVAGILYAKKAGASIINLSLSGLAAEGNSAVTGAINDAISDGIKVIGSAGNNGRDAKYYIPGGISGAIIMGACDKNGKRISSSNFGDTVDYYAVADSTSEAAAIMSGYLSKNMDKNGNYSIYERDGLFFREDYAENDSSDDKSSIKLYKTSEGPNIDVELYKGGKLLQTLGQSSGKYSAADISVHSLKVKSEDAGVLVIYPNGSMQIYTDKEFIVDITSGNYGNYTISSLTTKKELNETDGEVYKNPQQLSAMKNRIPSNAFKAQSDSLPDRINGYGIYESRQHGAAPYYAFKIHVDGYGTIYRDHSGNTPTSGWKGDTDKIKIYASKQKGRAYMGAREAHCLDHGLLGSDGTEFTFSTKQSKTSAAGGWQKYRVVTVRKLGGHQRLQIQIALKIPNEYTSRTVKKVWKVEKEDQKKDVTFELKRKKNGKADGVAASVTLKASDDKWTYTKDNLLKEDASGNRYTYKWVEKTKLKGYNRSYSSSGTTDTWTNAKKDIPYEVSINKKWLGDVAPSGVELNAKLQYTQVNYNVDKDGKRTTQKSTETKYWYTILNEENDWSDGHEFKVEDKEKTELKDFIWYENTWRYKNGEWKPGSPPGWSLGDNASGYAGKKQQFLNIAAPRTHMSVGKTWEDTEVADTVVEHLYGTCEGEGITESNPLDFGTVTLTKAENWSNKEISNLPVYYTRDENGELDYHIPTKWDSDEKGFEIDEDLAAKYKVHYYWVEEVDKSTSNGSNVSALIGSHTDSTDCQPDEDDPDGGGSGYSVNDSVAPAISSSAADSATGTKTGRVRTDSSTGLKYMDISETVTLTNVAPDCEYTLISGVINNDGTDAVADFSTYAFTPRSQNTFAFTSEKGNNTVTLTVPMSLSCGGYFEPSGKAVVVTEQLYDHNGNLVASEWDSSNKDQTVYYPEIKTHMISADPNSKYGHAMDAAAGDDDGSHFGTLQSSPDGTVTMKDTVTYRNLANGTYTLDGVLHRKGRTYRTGEDLGSVATASASFAVSGADPVSSGTAEVTYTFRFPESLYGGDFVSFETLKYNGIDLCDHADISDGKQTVRMGTSLRVIKKDADTGKPLANVTYQLFTKDASGNLVAYKKADGTDYTLTTGKDGKAEFRDLDINSYWIKETEVPKGYSLLRDPFEADAVEGRVTEKTAENITPPLLTTGGKGAGIFYLGAAIAAAVCAAAWALKKRKYN